MKNLGYFKYFINLFEKIIQKKKKNGSEAHKHIQA